MSDPLTIPSNVLARVSVVIPHYGDPAPTLSLIHDLLAQGPGELVVVDDCSPTPLPEPPDPAILVRRTSNGGFGSTVNSGAAIATGDYLVVLNSDLVVPADFLSLLSEQIAAHPAHVLSPQVLTRHSKPVWVGRRWPRTAAIAIDWLTVLARFRNSPWRHRAVGHQAAAVNQPTPVDWVVGAALVIPREAFMAVGGFDERFYMNSEEIDLQYRLRSTQHVPSVLLATPSVTHLAGGSSDPGSRRGWLVQAQLTYAAKYGFEGRLRSALRAATVVNLAVNLCRRARDARVHPVRTFHDELALLRQPVLIASDQREDQR